MNVISPLQKTLDGESLSRSYEEVYQIFSEIVDLEELVRESVLRALADGRDEVLLLDACCGSGATIEETARRVPYKVKDLRNGNVRLNCVGVDTHPLPGQIPEPVFRINPNNGVRNFGVDAPSFPRLVADIREDDALTLNTIQDASVDISICVAGLQYVGDPLRAIEVMRRKLRPYGVALWFTHLHRLLRSPSFETVMENSPGANDVLNFVYSRRFRASGVGLIQLINDPAADFSGFPYDFVGSVQAVPFVSSNDPLYFYRAGVYREKP